MKIKELTAAQTGQVTGYTLGSCKEYRQKLLRMGLVKGARFTMIRRAPLGDPLEINLKGFNLSLRAAEADVLEVERLDVS